MIAPTLSTKVIIAPWLERVLSVKDLKVLRQTQWFISIRDLVNWCEVCPDAPRLDVRCAVAEVLELIPETGPFKPMRLDIFRRLLYQTTMLSKEPK